MVLRAVAQKANLATDEHGFSNSKIALLNFFDPCKSVLSVFIRGKVWVFVKAILR